MQTCRDIQANLPAYSVEALPAPAADAVRTHCADCAACAAELAALQRTGALLATLPRPEPPADLWAGVAAATIDRAPRRIRLGWWQPATVFAALLVMLISGWSLRPTAQPLPTLRGTAAAPFAERYRMAHLQDPLTDRAAVGLLLVEETQ